MTQSGRSTYTKVEIFYTPTSAWIDMTTLYGYDWVNSTTITDNVDNPTATAEILLKRSIFNYVLSPLVANSKANVSGVLVDVYKKIRVSVAVMPVRATPSSGDYVQIFIGRISSVDWAADLITLECRDLGGDLIDLWLETIMVLCTSATAVQTVMQTILTAAGALVSQTFTLYSPNGSGGTPYNPSDAPGWNINPTVSTQPNQQIMPVLTALQTLADQLGWSVKYRWQANTSAYQLVLFNPRAGVTSLRSFASNQYFSVDSLTVAQQDIRNYCVVTYYDNNGQPQSVVSQNATSITKYGRKYMRVAEELTSQLATSTDAQKMADAAINDLALPIMLQQVRMPLFWPVETGDTYTFKANGIHYDSDQLLSVYEWKHELTPDKASTTLSLRGKPVGRQATWFDRLSTNVNKTFGTANISTYDDRSGNLAPNGNFGQFSRG